MTTPIEYADASPQVRAVYDDIKKTRNVADVNNFWKHLARDPVTLKRTWEKGVYMGADSTNPDAVKRHRPQGGATATGAI